MIKTFFGSAVRTITCKKSFNITYIFDTEERNGSNCILWGKDAVAHGFSFVWTLSVRY